MRAWLFPSLWVGLTGGALVRCGGPRRRLVAHDLGQEVLGALGLRVVEELVGGRDLDDLALRHEDDAGGGAAARRRRAARGRRRPCRRGPRAPGAGGRARRPWPWGCGAP